MCLLTPLERRLSSTPDRSMYKVQDISGPKAPYLRWTLSGSSRMPSASSRRRASSRAHVCILWSRQHLIFDSVEAVKCFVVTRRKILKQSTSAVTRGREIDIRSVWLEDVCDTGNEKTADESIVPHVLPTLLHILLAGLEAKQVAGRRVIVVTAEVAAGREALDVLGPAGDTASAKAMRQRTSRHCECAEGLLLFRNP